MANQAEMSLRGLDGRVALVTGGASTPIGRIGEVEDVAAAVAFLSSAHASYITGEVLALNGGWW